jgi:phasin family protein
MTTTTILPATKANSDALTKGAKTVEHIANINTETVTKSGNAAIAGFQELAKAYQELATKNAGRLTASLQALAQVKTPTEFVELQRKLIAEGVEAAVSDGSHIAKLTAAVFAASFEPVQKQVEALQNTVKH